MRWPIELSPKGSVSTCILTGVSTFLHCAFTAQARFLKAAPVLEGGDRMRQGQLAIVVGPVRGEGDQTTFVRHLEEAGKLHERVPLNQHHMLGGDALRGRDRCLRERRCGCWRLRWC